jgi:hypothetical protein
MRNLPLQIPNIETMRIRRNLVGHDGVTIVDAHATKRRQWLRMMGSLAPKQRFCEGKVNTVKGVEQKYSVKEASARLRRYSLWAN